MALSMVIPTASGGSVQYHVVSQLSIDPVAQATAVYLNSYVSQDTYNNGFQPASSIQFSFQGIPSGDQTIWAQNQILTRPEWATATIV